VGEQTHPEFEAGRCTAFVSDLTKEDLPASIPSESVDFILLVFVMSALAPGTPLTRALPASLPPAAPTWLPAKRRRGWFVRSFICGECAWAEQMVDVLAKLHRVLKPGGAILFRDYGEYDMAQLRFLSRKNPNKIDECMYVRWDGTTSYFFSLGTLCPSTSTTTSS
jgi:SAM-dependent methyltransferase